MATATAPVQPVLPASAPPLSALPGAVVDVPRGSGLASHEGLSNGSRGEALSRASAGGARLGTKRGPPNASFFGTRRPAALGIAIGVAVFILVRFVLAAA